MKTNQEISRRNFLALGSMAALAGGAASLAACAPSNASSDDDKKADEVSAEVKPADETMECDIAIVGAGGAGVWAAVEACRAGKNVIVIEKGQDVGVGNGAIAGGPFMVGSKLQQDAGIDFSVEEAFNHIMEYGHWSTNAAAIKRAVELSGSTVDQFTEEFGVPTGLRPDNYGAGHASVRCNFQSDPKDSKTQKKGVDRMGPLQQWAESNGAQFVFNTTGKTLIMENGACTGVQCEQESKIIDVKAPAVIVCTGGFLGNTDMMLERFGTFVNPLGSVLSVGEGIDMVQAAGGQLSTQWGIAGNEFSGSNQNAEGIWGKKNAAFAIGIYGTMLVNNQGRRFSNEGKFANLPLALGGAISLVGGQYYAIVDQAYIDGLNSGVDAWTLCGSDSENWRTGEMTLKDKPLENVQADIDAAVEAGWVFKADSVEALAEAISAPELVETVETYNAYCAEGKDRAVLQARLLPPARCGRPLLRHAIRAFRMGNHRRHSYERQASGNRQQRTPHQGSLCRRRRQWHADERTLLRLRRIFPHVRIQRRPHGRHVRSRGYRSVRTTPSIHAGFLLPLPRKKPSHKQKRGRMHMRPRFVRSV